jgi:hypothetical protein
MIAATPCLPRDFCGQVEINVFMGGLTNVNIRQSYKLAETNGYVAAK